MYRPGLLDFVFCRTQNTTKAGQGIWSAGHGCAGRSLAVSPCAAKPAIQCAAGANGVFAVAGLTTVRWAQASRVQLFGTQRFCLCKQTRAYAGARVAAHVRYLAPPPQVAGQLWCACTDLAQHTSGTHQSQGTADINSCCSRACSLEPHLLVVGVNLCDVCDSCWVKAQAKGALVWHQHVAVLNAAACIDLAQRG
jgi:hypothetical protein